MRARAQREMSTAPQLPQNAPEVAGFLYDKTAVFDTAMKKEHPVCRKKSPKKYMNEGDELQPPK